MLRSAASKAMWVGRVTVFLVGPAAILALLLGVALTGPAQAETFTVTNTDDAGGGSLRQQIAAAASGDTIGFSVTGTITLTGGELVINKNLTIAGPGAKDLIVSGGNRSRVFNVASGATVEISGLTITGGRVVGSTGSSGATGFTTSSGGTSGQSGGNGSDAGGGGVLNNGALTLRDVAVSANTATGGAGGTGGLGGDGPSNTCSSSDHGGNGGNGGNGGGAMGGGVLNNGALTLQGATVSANTATGGAGGFGGRGGNGGNDSAFCVGGNGGRGGAGGAGGAGRGGAVFNSGTLNATNSTLDGDVAAGGRGGGGGGGGDGGSGGSRGVGGNGGNGSNGGAGEGGATHDAGGDAALANSTVSANQALRGDGGNGGFSGSGSPGGTSGGNGSAGTGRGGGVFGGSTLGNTIVAPNTASTSGPNIFGTFASRGNNLAGDPDGAVGFVGSDIQNADPELGPLQDNGGQTKTRALQEGSAAIDAANTASAPPKDQRGVVRPQGTAADIGASEVDVTPTVTKATPAGSRVSPKANVVATFSEPMDAKTLGNPDTLKSTTFVLKKGATTVSAKVTLDSTGKTAILNPTKSLKAGARYTATVSTEVEDQWGTALDQDPATAGNQPKTWSFKVRR